MHSLASQRIRIRCHDWSCMVSMPTTRAEPNRMSSDLEVHTSSCPVRIVKRGGLNRCGIPTSPGTSVRQVWPVGQHARCDPMARTARNRVCPVATRIPPRKKWCCLRLPRRPLPTPPRGHYIRLRRSSHQPAARPGDGHAAPATLALLLATALTVTAGFAAAEIGTPKAADWPQWQGPDRTAVSKETGLLQVWPKDGPRCAGRPRASAAATAPRPSPPAASSCMGNRGNDEFVIALAEEDGKELWADEIGTVRSGGGGYPGPRCTPTVDGDRVYALGLDGDLVCLEAATGKEPWRKNLVEGLRRPGRPAGATASRR